MIRKFIRQLLVSLLVFAAMLFAFSRIDWMEVFKLRRSIIEKKLDSVHWELFTPSGTLVGNKMLTAPLDSLLSILCQANGMKRDKVTLYLIRSDEVNAHACPGNRLLVHTALIESCRNAEELCGVLAHELAHIQCGHIMQKLAKEMGTTAMVALIGGNSGTEALAEIMRILSSTAYDRTLEREADRLAVRYLLCAGIDPRPFGEFLERLAEEENRPSLTEWISTHPNSKERSRLVYSLSDRKSGKHSFIRLMSDGEWNTYRQAVRAAR